jgi:hypothetical protein
MNILGENLRVLNKQYVEEKLETLNTTVSGLIELENINYWGIEVNKLFTILNQLMLMQLTIIIR